jgi:hypothetical protein
MRQPAPPRPWPLRFAAPFAGLAAVVAAFAYVSAHDPNHPGHYPVCPLLHFTGVYCPGCGGLRSAYAVAHGDWAGALGANSLAVGGYAAFAAFWVWWLVCAARGRPVRVPLRPVHWWVLGGVALVFTVVRNVPFGAALAP